MTHFAKLDENNIVIKVIVASQEYMNNYVDSSPGRWIETSKRTYGGVHLDGGTPLRKNYAGFGFTYDETKDAFIPPQAYPSWTLNETTCLWEAPIAYPTDGEDYRWDEDTTSWVLMSE